MSKKSTAICRICKKHLPEPFSECIRLVFPVVGGNVFADVHRDCALRFSKAVLAEIDKA